MNATKANGTQLQIAVFIDFENIALGLRDGATFDVRRLLDRLLEKGKVIVKVAYADWHRFRDDTRSLHENGIELIEIPRRATSGKNSADIRLVVDAMDLSWSKAHIDTFVIVSGDSDFSPLVAKLKENGRHVIGLGMRDSTSPLLANGCDEFIYYEDLEHDDGDAAGPAPDKSDAFRLLADTVRALQREGFDEIQASLVKDTMKRKRPAFSEAALGYRSFSQLLEDARDAGVVGMRSDERSGTYVVTDVTTERRRRGGNGARGTERRDGRRGRERAGGERRNGAHAENERRDGDRSSELAAEPAVLAASPPPAPATPPAPAPRQRRRRGSRA